MISVWTDRKDIYLGACRRRDVIRSPLWMRLFEEVVDNDCILNIGKADQNLLSRLIETARRLVRDIPLLR